MAVVSDIVNSWRDPRGLIRDKLQAPREERALATLMGASLLDWIAAWPYAAREAHLHPEVPFNARIGGAMMAILFLMPLLMYALAWLSHFIAKRLTGGQGTGLGARIALFQTLLATAPVVLLIGIVRGLVGLGPLSTLLGLVWAAAFLWIWINMLREAERG